MLLNGKLSTRAKTDVRVDLCAVQPHRPRQVASVFTQRRELDSIHVKSYL